MNRGRLTATGIWLAAMVLALLALWRAPPLQTDLGQFLPQGGDAAQRQLLQVLRDGPGARLIMAAITLDRPTPPAGTATEQETTLLADSTRQLATALREGGRFRLILGAGNPLSARERALLNDYRYLLGDVDLSPAALQAALQERLHELSLGIPLDHAQLRADPTMASRQLLQGLAGSGEDAPRRHHGVWFSPDGEHALLLLHSAYPAFDLDGQQTAIDALQAAFANLPQHDELRLTISGAPWFAVQSRQLIQSTTQSLTLWASLGVALLILASYRSLRAALLIAVPLASAIAVGAAAVVLWFGQLHGIALAFGITLIGVTVDYPIHLFSHGGDAQAARRLWPTLRMGVVTTAIGFAALLLSDFAGLAQLGLFAVAGLLAAALTTRWLLPTWQGGTAQPDYTAATPPPQPQPAGLPTDQRHGHSALLLTLILAALAWSGSQGTALWESRLDRLSPVPEQELAREQQMRQWLGAAEPGQLLIIEAADVETLLQASEALAAQLAEARQQGMLDTYQLPSAILPSRHSQLAHQAALPPPDQLSQRLQQAQDELPFRAGTFDPFIKAVVESRALAPLTLEQLEEMGLGLRLQGLLRRQDNGRVLGLVPLGGVSDPAALQGLLKASASDDVRFVDLASEAATLVAAYRDQALWLMGLGIALILLLLGWRHPAGILVALPVLAALTLDVALLNLLGERLTLFHIASLLLVLGIGLDYSLFWHRCRAEDNCHATVRALLICSASTLLVFGLLAAAPLPVLHAIGITVSLGVLLTLLLVLSDGGPSRDIGVN